MEIIFKGRIFPNNILEGMDSKKCLNEFRIFIKNNDITITYVGENRNNIEEDAIALAQNIVKNISFESGQYVYFDFFDGVMKTHDDKHVTCKTLKCSYDIKQNVSKDHLDNGKLKVRGIEIRRSDTPKLISNLQEAMLGKLVEAKTASEFYMKIPEAIEVLREYTRKVIDNECALTDLIFKTHVSRGCDEYRQFNNQMAAMKQLKLEGIETLAGQTIRYIITDHKSRNYQKRVIIPELADGKTQYDREKYYEYLLRAAESMLLPFRYTEEQLDGIMKRRMQRSLCGY